MRRWPLTRLRFSDENNALKVAERNVETGEASIRHWWSTKYKLPPNHELFQQQTTTEILQEYYEDLLINRKRVLKQIEDDTNTTEQEKALANELNQLNEALGYDTAYETDDDWFNKMEKALEDGALDLDKM